ncbi:MAG: 5'-nucleotidase C-terminal domain-containing protein [Candidatus Aminicenantes bacterium]|nr:5'-nucleotidase C-terminal domain-containing protein [Candidatus Aminicenantes bacterium]
MFKKFLVLMVSLFFLLSVPWMSFGEKLTILHVNDTHSHLYPFGPHNDYGGIARMSTLIKKLKSKGGNVLTFHAGDVFVGTFAFNKYLGYPELKMMEGLYDAMALGNHELDLGIDALSAILGGSLAGGNPVVLPILCANIVLEEGHPLKSFVLPHMVMYAGNIKVGLVGVVTTDPYNYSDEVNAVLTDPYMAAGLTAGYLKQYEKCNIVICLSHLGILPDMEGLSTVPGIDIIVGGHSHTAIFEPIIKNGKIIVQAGEFGKYLGELEVDVDNTGAITQVNLIDYKLHRIKKKIKKDPTLFPVLFNLRMGIITDPRFGPVYSKRIAKAKKNLEERWEEGNPHRDTPLGNLITDAIKAGVENNGHYADFALESNGFIGHRVYKGKVVGNDILRTVPYGYDPVSGLGFKIKVVQLAGAQILAGLEFSVSQVEYTDDLSMQFSGLTFEYDSSKPALPIEDIVVGNLSRLDPTSVKINGQPLLLNGPPYYGFYWVALNEQIVSFLGSMGLVPLAIEVTNLFEYDLVRDYMKKLKKLKYKSEGRIIDRALIK